MTKGIFETFYEEVGGHYHMKVGWMILFLSLSVTLFTIAVVLLTGFIFGWK